MDQVSRARLWRAWHRHIIMVGRTRPWAGLKTTTGEHAAIQAGPAPSPRRYGPRMRLEPSAARLLMEQLFSFAQLMQAAQRRDHQGRPGLRDGDRFAVCERIRAVDWARAGINPIQQLVHPVFGQRRLDLNRTLSARWTSWRLPGRAASLGRCQALRGTGIECARFLS
jgi:hypothetical protein